MLKAGGLLSTMAAWYRSDWIWPFGSIRLTIITIMYMSYSNKLLLRIYDSIKWNENKFRQLNIIYHKLSIVTIYYTQRHIIRLQLCHIKEVIGVFSKPSVSKFSHTWTRLSLLSSHIFWFWIYTYYLAIVTCINAFQ